MVKSGSFGYTWFMATRKATTAAYHANTRRAHAQEIAEDYAEAIADLIDEQGEARVVDLARRLGVSHVTVVRTIARLAARGLVVTRPYRSIFLTEEGADLAAEAKRRHRIVVEALERLGVDPETARADAEGIEHHVSAKTLAALEALVARPRPRRRERRSGSRVQ